MSLESLECPFGVVSIMLESQFEMQNFRPFKSFCLKISFSIVFGPNVDADTGTGMRASSTGLLHILHPLLSSHTPCAVYIPAFLPLPVKYSAFVKETHPPYPFGTYLPYSGAVVS